MEMNDSSLGEDVQMSAAALTNVWAFQFAGFFAPLTSGGNILLPRIFSFAPSNGQIP
jgi:hypothetical protein